MLRIKAFRGLRPTPELVAQVACVPYDVVNREEAAALAAGQPNSLLRVDRAEIDLAADTDPYAAEVYAKARENFLRLQSDGVLVRESEPCVYVYRLQMGEHAQTGVAAVCHIEDYEADVIKKHEKTRRDKEDDRTRLIGELGANTGPVFLTYQQSASLDAQIADIQRGVPFYDFTAPDGVRHTVWRVAGAETLCSAFAEVPCAYVADGHHRTASAVRVGRERRAANPEHDGSEDYNWFLSVLFPGNQLQILPYNRVSKDLNGHGNATFRSAVEKTFRVQPTTSPTPTQPGDVRMYHDGTWHQLTWETDSNADPIAQLDVSVLQDRLLAPILGIDDPRSSKRIDFIGGIRGTDELVRLVDRGDAAVAFSMFPTTVEQLMAIADAGQIMPPKSTWFEPKLRSGLFIHTF
ncbi:MAG TPA: DUF1015 family protein [Chthoniobacteraceae bacterium]|nr:hypothetical protein [Chthoniobacter sp.]HEV7867045.1 DUF1015 family protein [Chthoniobacteraceae bacterium]